MPQRKEPNGRRTLRRLLGAALVRVVAKVNPDTLRAAVRVAVKVDPGALRPAMRITAKADPAASRAAVREAVKVDPWALRAAMGVVAEVEPAAVRAAVRDAVKVDPGALRAALRVAAKVNPQAVREAAADLPAPGPPAGRPPDGACLVCHSPRVWRREVRYVAKPALRKTVSSCDRCGHVAIDEIGPSHYRAATSVDQLPASQRIGTTERPGREFQMARMALQILGRKDPQDVLVYGAGRSLDNLHIQRLPRAGTVWIADIMKVRDDAPFIDVNDPGTRRFPVVVASEVVEHFRDPWSDFATMLGMVEPRGLLVCGTNIHDGRPNLERDRYIYFPDHTSYYSVASIRRIAAAMGFHVDFRLPDGLGRRKRYLLFTRSPAVLGRAAAYFGRVPLAPSEVTFQRRQERLAQSTAR